MNPLQVLEIHLKTWPEARPFDLFEIFAIMLLEQGVQLPKTESFGQLLLQLRGLDLESAKQRLHDYMNENP